MGYLAADALAEIQRVDPSLHPVLTIAWPDTTRRYSLAGSPLSSAAYGPILPLVESGEDFTFLLPNHEGGLIGVQTSVILADFGNVIRDLTTGRYRHKLEGSAATISYFSPNVATPPVLFTGVLVQLERASTFRWKLTLRTNDAALTQSRWQLPVIDLANFPYVTSPNLDKFVPVFFGRFDSNDGTVAGSTGSLKAIRLNLSDGTGGFPYRYLASLTLLSTILRVQVNGAVLASSAWVRTYGVINGITYTEIWLQSDPGASATVTFDAFGISKDGGESAYKYARGTGEPITNPVEQMRWMLTNFAFNAYRPTLYGNASPAEMWQVAPYGDSAAPIDTASWDIAVTYANARRFRGVLPPIDDPSSVPGDYFAEWSRAWGFAPYWTPTGKIALATMDWIEPVPYFDGTALLKRVRVGSEDRFTPSRPAKNARIDSIRSASWVVPAQSAARSVISVNSGISRGPVVDTVDNRFADAMRAFEPTVMPSQVTRVWLADMATQPGNSNFMDGSPIDTLPAVQYGAATALVGTGHAPLMRCGPAAYMPNGHPYFEVSETGPLYFGGAAADTLANLVTPSQHTIFLVFRLRSATSNNVLLYRNHPIVSADGTYLGIYVRNNGGVYQVYGYGYDGATKFTNTIDIALNTWYVVRFRHYGGYIYISVDNWTEPAGVACGDLTYTGTELLNIGGWPGGGFYANADVAAVIVANSNMHSQGAAVYSTAPGLHQNWLVWKMLSDRYGI